MSDEPIQIVKMLKRDVWIEWCNNGDVTVNFQYEGKEPMCFARFCHIAMVTDRSGLDQAARAAAIRIGATEPVEQRHPNLDDSLTTFNGLLKSDSNPCGWPLENLLVKIREEIESQSDHIKNGELKLKDELLECNQAICESLRYATGVQHVALMHMRQN